MEKRTPLEGGPQGGLANPLESVTADARRRVLEARVFGPDSKAQRLDSRFLGALGLAVVHPLGERFPQEGPALASIARAESTDRDSATQRLAGAALEVWSTAREGTAASRVDVLRAVVAFLLHHSVSWSALQSP